MSSDRTTAMVLRRTNYGEADRILRILTPEGQRSVIAKGARKEGSKLAGSIELFSISDIVIMTGKGNLGVLRSARMQQFYRHILEDYDRLQFAYEVINLVTKASENIDETDWFNVLAEVYAGLDTMTIPLQLTQVWFYLHYAELTGYGLNLDRDVSGAALNAERTYMYDVNEKGLRPAEQGDVNAVHIKLMRLIAAKPIATIAQIGGVNEVLSNCWLIARQHASV